MAKIGESHFRSLKGTYLSIFPKLMPQNLMIKEISWCSMYFLIYHGGSAYNLLWQYTMNLYEKKINNTPEGTYLRAKELFNDPNINPKDDAKKFYSYFKKLNFFLKTDQVSQAYFMCFSVDDTSAPFESSLYFYKNASNISRIKDTLIQKYNVEEKFDQLKKIIHKKGHQPALLQLFVKKEWADVFLFSCAAFGGTKDLSEFGFPLASEVLSSVQCNGLLY
ncbi:hypothetical protein [Holospora curviuscula]|nr:hypothetical protein [Holospora curviuscula]